MIKIMRINYPAKALAKIFKVLLHSDKETDFVPANEFSSIIHLLGDINFWGETPTPSKLTLGPGELIAKR